MKWYTVLLLSEKEYSFILIILTPIPLSTLNFCNQDMYSTVSMASHFSIAQACPGYFGSELLKTERKEERNLHSIVVQKKQMLKLNYISPKRSIKFTDCANSNTKRYTSEFSLWNGCPEHINFSSLKYHRSQGNRASFNCRLSPYTGYNMILRAVTQRINMTHWTRKPTLMCICYLQWKMDRAHLPRSGLCFTPQLQWGGNEETTSYIQL